MYLCTWYHLALNSTMAKVGYIFKAAGYDGFDTDVEWMKQYGCVQVIEEENGHEKTASPMETTYGKYGTGRRNRTR